MKKTLALLSLTALAIGLSPASASMWSSSTSE
jgi:hypothetical protein